MLRRDQDWAVIRDATTSVAAAPNEETRTTRPGATFETLYRKGIIMRRLAVLLLFAVAIPAYASPIELNKIPGR